MKTFSLRITALPALQRASLDRHSFVSSPLPSKLVSRQPGQKIGHSFVGSPLPSKLVSRQPVRTMALFGGSKAVPSSLYEIPIKSIDGQAASMSAYKGKVLLIVNVASQCGFTPQYKELVELYNKYKDRGLEIIAQPCNQFGGQEPGSNQEVKAFAQRQGASFPLLIKGDVNGEKEEPLWTFLKAQKGGILGSDLKWNFSKFLVDRSGKVQKRYGSVDPPLAIEQDIVALL